MYASIQAISTVVGIIEGCGMLGATLGAVFMLPFLNEKGARDDPNMLFILLFPSMIFAVTPLLIHFGMGIYKTRSLDLINCCK